MEDVQSPGDLADAPGPAQLAQTGPDAPSALKTRVGEMFARYAQAHLYGSDMARNVGQLNIALNALEKLKDEIVSTLEK